MAAWIGLILVGAFGTALAAFGVPAELFGLTAGGSADVVRIAGHMVSICAAVFLSLSEAAGLAFRQCALWTAIALGAVSVYVHRSELLAVAAEITGDVVADVAESTDPQTETDSNGRRLIAIRANAHGQFDVDTLVNGTHVSMLADTGATYVTLCYEDARRIGIDVNGLAFTVPMRTANGRAHAAVITLDDLAVGGILVRDVQAVVSQEGVLHVSLLGMSYFREIGSFQLSGDQLVLRE